MFLHSTLLIESAQQYLATDKPNFYSASYFATARTNHKTHLAQIVKVEKVAATGSPRKKSQTHLPARIFRPGETRGRGGLRPLGSCSRIAGSWLPAHALAAATRWGR